MCANNYQGNYCTGLSSKIITFVTRNTLRNLAISVLFGTWSFEYVVLVARRRRIHFYLTCLGSLT